MLFPRSITRYGAAPVYGKKAYQYKYQYAANNQAAQMRENRAEIHHCYCPFVKYVPYYGTAPGKCQRFFIGARLHLSADVL